MSHMKNVILVKLQRKIKTCLVTNWYTYIDKSSEPFKFETKKCDFKHVRMIEELKNMYSSNGGGFE